MFRIHERVTGSLYIVWPGLFETRESARAHIRERARTESIGEVRIVRVRTFAG